MLTYPRKWPSAVGAALLTTCAAAAACTSGSKSTPMLCERKANVVSEPAPTSPSSDEKPSFTAFESGQVRPLALSSDGKLLFAVNTPDNRLEIFANQADGLVHRSSVTVGLEPVAVAVKGDRAWVVNHLSDSVSVVAIEQDGYSARVVRTLLVGDEPRDIVFAGPSSARAFITTAHRGQNSSRDPQLSTPGVGRADVWVFDTATPDNSLTGQPLTIVTLFSDTPRALAVTPDGKRVYAAAFYSGNRTTTIPEMVVQQHGGLPPVPDAPPNAPITGLIVKFNGEHWVDELDRAWDGDVNFNLPDKDVFTIDAIATPPREVASGVYTGVGATLFNMAVNPVSGAVYVSNTEAFNEVRFEGPGIRAGRSVRGHLVESRITILDGQGTVTPRHLNKHIDYSVAGAPLPNEENEKSLAMPTGMVVTNDGSTLYVAALGSSKLGVYATKELEDDTFEPSLDKQIVLRGGGPTGLVMDEGLRRLYVMTRFDNGISVVDTDANIEIAHLGMHNPEPETITNGRRFLYDAALSSSHGDQACASCHIFGDLDALAWDLGNPDGVAVANKNPFTTELTPLNSKGEVINPFTGVPFDLSFHPMKGPMATQSLRGLANHGPMHWRGDRNGGLDSPAVPMDEMAAFMKFSGAFESLLGRSNPLSDEEMRAFAEFGLQLTYPPNPIRNLDNSLTPAQQEGFEVFTSPRKFDRVRNCIGCHSLDPGMFGTSGISTVENQPQRFKVPHLRNVYTKVGMFGMPELFNFDKVTNPLGVGLALPGLLQGHTGDQVRGYGIHHDGSIDSPLRFFAKDTFSTIVGNSEGFVQTEHGVHEMTMAEQFVWAFPSEMAPIVGQQVTIDKSSTDAVTERIALLQARADEGECELVAKANVGGREAGFLYLGGSSYLPDRAEADKLSDKALRALAKTNRQEITFTCVPPGSGRRLALDRDSDGFLDGDERDACSDPASLRSTPVAP